MYGQSLGGGEVLNIRWATEDPNPRAVQEKQADAEKAITESVIKNLATIGQRGNILDYDMYYQSNPASMQYGYTLHYSQEQMNRYYNEWAARDPEGYAEWYAANIDYIQQANTAYAYSQQAQSAPPQDLSQSASGGQSTGTSDVKDASGIKSSSGVDCSRLA